MPNPAFRVYVNQVDVGSLPEQDYRAIVAEAKQSVKGDRRLYLAQALNVLRCFLRLAWIVVQFMPLFLFFGVTVCVFASPTTMAEVLNALREANSVDVISGIRSFLTVAALSTIVFLGLAVALTGHRFGYINEFDSAVSGKIAFRIREILEVPADGDVEVHVGKGFML